MALDSLNACLSEQKWDRTAWLVERAQSGDRQAFGDLVEQFQPTVFALCRQRLGDVGEAAELTQEVFLHAMRRIGQLREPDRFAGWLKQMAVRMSINRATRRLPPASLDQAYLDDAAAIRQEPLDQMIAQEQVHLLRAGLERLAPLDRDTLVAFYIHGLSIVEVAKRHRAPVGTIKRRLHTARTRLKALLDPDWADQPGSNDDPDGDPERPLDPTPEPGSRARRAGVAMAVSHSRPALALV